MSIQEALAALEAQTSPKVQKFVPTSRYNPKRRLYLAGKAIADFNDPNSATNLIGLKGFIVASMTRWVSGGRVHGNKKRGLFIDRLDPPPDEVWEMRVTEPSVQARLFGRFCEQDTFILTNFHTRQFLGNRGSLNWNTAMNDCLSHWNNLGLPLLVEATIDKYISENFDAFPI